MCTRQFRKVIWDLINTLFLTTVAVEPTFVAFFQHSQTHFHGLSCQFFQISLKKRELKTTHNAFQDCRVHFSRQPFSKQLYIRFKGTRSNSRERSNFGFPKIYVANSNLTNQKLRTTGTTCVLGLLLMKNCCIQLFAGATIIQNSLSSLMRFSEKRS